MPNVRGGRNLGENGSAQEAGEFLVRFRILVHRLPQAREIVVSNRPNEEVAMKSQALLFLGHTCENITCIRGEVVVFSNVSV